MRSGGDSGRDRALAYLRETVLSDPAVLGTFINEQALATEIGVSRTPVREALLMLAAENLVQLVPNRGALVPTLPGREIAELMQARGVIECWAATACLAMDNAPVDDMNALLRMQRAISDVSEAKEFIELDSQFHALLVASADNSVLDRLYQSLRARHVLLGVAALERSSSRRAEVLAEHQAIVDALARKDPDEAEASILRHLNTTAAVLIQG